MCTGRSGCASASLVSSLTSKGSYILFQRARPRARVASMFSAVNVRDGRVSKPVDPLIFAPSRKAVRQLIVRGMPLKLIHLRPTSRIVSAADRSVSEEGRSKAICWSLHRDSGEFSVNVAAA